MCEVFYLKLVFRKDVKKNLKNYQQFPIIARAQTLGRIHSQKEDYFDYKQDNQKLEHNENQEILNWFN